MEEYNQMRQVSSVLVMSLLYIQMLFASSPPPHSGGQTNDKTLKIEAKNSFNMQHKKLTETTSVFFSFKLQVSLHNCYYSNTHLLI